MSWAASYPWIKGLHVASVIALVAGTLAQALHLASVKADSSTEVTSRFCRAERVLTVPAMVVALTSGVTLASVGRLFPAPVAHH